MYDKDWKPNRKGGKPVPRLDRSSTPCWRCPKIPQGVKPIPQNAQELSAKNRQAWVYSIECAVDNRGILPQDEITVQNNALIRRVTESFDRKQADILPILASLLGARL
jgi:hypothetical protein